MADGDSSRAEKVRRRLQAPLRGLGFERTKTTFFTRSRALTIHFIHLHKYSFAPEFRVHPGIRVSNDAFPAAALNGPDSHPYVCKGAPGGRVYNFAFHLAPETWVRCADEIAAYVRTVALPWFDTWSDHRRLLAAPDSPLDADARAALAAALDAGPDPERLALTRRLLGVG
jgi:hypothetical protein